MAMHSITNFIERDIKERGLKAGDPYLTAEELGRIVGVSRATADRAMKSLSRRHILMRRQRSGTFVGPRAETSGAKPCAALSNIHLIAPRSASAQLHLDVRAVANALGERFPDAVMTLHLIPAARLALAAQKLLLRLGASGDLREAVVLFDADVECAKEIEDSGVAAVIVAAHQSAAEVPHVVMDRADPAPAVLDAACAFIARALSGTLAENERHFTMPSDARGTNRPDTLLAPGVRG